LLEKLDFGQFRLTIFGLGRLTRLLLEIVLSSAPSSRMSGIAIDNSHLRSIHNQIVKQHVGEVEQLTE
jgi:hypothetical protein